MQQQVKRRKNGKHLKFNYVDESKHVYKYPYKYMKTDQRNFQHIMENVVSVSQNFKQLI